MTQTLSNGRRTLSYGSMEVLAATQKTVAEGDGEGAPDAAVHTVAMVRRRLRVRT